jgi:hypothetical protein
MGDTPDNKTNNETEDFQETWYKEYAKKDLDELKEKFETHPSINRKLSSEEFKEIYEDYRDSGSSFNEYMKNRKFR